MTYGMRYKTQKAQTLRQKKNKIHLCLNANFILPKNIKLYPYSGI